MQSKLRLAGMTGALLLLLGGAGFAGGSLLHSANDCVSGMELYVEPVDENETTDLAGNTTAFSELSPVEQRIFLEAYTDVSGGAGVSDRYANWSQSWFEEMGTDGEKHTPLYVTYRGRYYAVMEVAVDCGVSGGVFLQVGGILSVVLGGSILGLAGLWKLIETVR